MPLASTTHEHSSPGQLRAGPLELSLPFQERNMSWLLSAVLHMAVMLALSLYWQVEPRGTPGEPVRDAGIVLVEVTDVTVPGNYFSEADEAVGRESPFLAKSVSNTTADSNTDASGLPNATSPPIDLTGALPTSEPLLSIGGDGLPSATGMAMPSGKKSDGAAGSAGQAHTYVFGTQGVGHKFVYVFDRSASMDGFQGRPLSAAKRELIKSLQNLDRIHQFQIVFYNDRTSVFTSLANAQPRMMWGDDATKRAAERYVRGVIADGGTRHMDALRLALGMAPDVIFFLTDADEPQLTPQELADIARRNERVGATINAIQFGTGPDPHGDNFLRRLARQNNGEFAYVDVTELPR